MPSCSRFCALPQRHRRVIKEYPTGMGVGRGGGRFECGLLMCIESKDAALKWMKSSYVSLGGTISFLTSELFQSVYLLDFTQSARLFAAQLPLIRARVDFVPNVLVHLRGKLDPAFRCSADVRT
jgi:hypothetical protein